MYMFQNFAILSVRKSLHAWRALIGCIFRVDAILAKFAIGLTGDNVRFASRKYANLRL